MSASTEIDENLHRREESGSADVPRLLAMWFLVVPENAADRLRRRMFQALRDERASAAG